MKNIKSLHKINIFGSTGSIGRQTVEIILQDIELFEVNILCGFYNYQLIAQQAFKLRPKIILVHDNFVNLLREQGFMNSYAISEFYEIISNSDFVDTSVLAISGFAGFKFCLEAIKCSKKIALANKESVIYGGEFLLQHAAAQNTEIIPVDSEHNSVFQILSKRNNFRKIILTASGGPFLFKTKDYLQEITFSEAIKHPKWNMGWEISVNSATLMNKALELIEAFYLFKTKDLEVVIHPESIIHSLVEYADGGMLALLSKPNMKLHIANAIYYPRQYDTNIETLNLLKIQQLNFFSYKESCFPFVDIAFELINSNQLYKAIVLNTANEFALQKFKNCEISFLEIANFVEKAMANIKIDAPKDIDDIFATECRVRALLD